MKLYENERQDIADASAQFVGTTMQFLHRGAFGLPDGGICIFGNDSADTDARAIQEFKEIQEQASVEDDSEVYVAEIKGTWVVVTHGSELDAEDWKQTVWNTWFAICDAHADKTVAREVTAATKGDHE